MDYVVHVGYDPEERRYFVEASDVYGLNVEAESFDELIEITLDLVPDLITHTAEGSTIRFERAVVLA